MEVVTSTAPAPKISAVRMTFLIVTCGLIMLLEGFDIQALGIAAPILMPLLKLDPVQAGQVFSAAQAGVVLGALSGGVLSDMWGRRNVLLMAVLVFGAFNLSTAFVHDFNTLLWARALTGFGLGAAMPNVIGLAVDYASPKNRVKAVTAIMAGMPIGGAAAALFARLYFKDLGWQSLFYIGGIIPILLTLLILFLPNAKAVRVADSGQKVGLWSALFGGGRAPSTLLLWVVFFLTSSVLYMVLNWLPSLMTQRGMDVQTGQLASLVFNLVSVAGTLVMGAVIDRYGYKWAMPLAYMGFLVGMCGMAFTGTVEPLLISVGIVGFFLLGAQYSLNGVSPMYYPKTARGLGTGTAIAFGRVGSITGPLMAGYILKTGIGPLHGPEGVALAMLPLIVVAGIAVTVLALSAKILDD
ncbi:putative 3-hydroxyphenylpropionic acid transporter [Asticcacaulis biprosthecium C19]|uniref:Putative 3-hydroxyphenylpropionic acid transporter n=1 Tax=Asticcacaulis biprosthecium C19 TaxID=715226 RepID=F4QNZ2_9CAUL|nr:MFS transporter [Asticcacaulis biprosthecium]EGF91050.1 putative 3-hydroxyphenylpropionic acid transporter [Asticcacaulis biprosthecium C19]